MYNTKIIGPHIPSISLNHVDFTCQIANFTSNWNPCLPVNDTSTQTIFLFF